MHVKESRTRQSIGSPGYCLSYLIVNLYAQAYCAWEMLVANLICKERQRSLPVLARKDALLETHQYHSYYSDYIRLLRHYFTLDPSSSEEHEAQLAPRP